MRDAEEKPVSEKALLYLHPCIVAQKLSDPMRKSAFYDLLAIANFRTVCASLFSLTI